MKPYRGGSDNSVDDHDAYLPSEAEIAAACREIQAGWSEVMRRRRGGDRREAAVPAYRVYRAPGGVLFQAEDGED